MRSLEKPKDTEIDLLREWLDRPEGGDFFLQGREAAMWNHDEDLLTLSSRQAERDNLTQWICNRLVPWYHRRWGHRIPVPFYLNEPCRDRAVANSEL